MGTHANFKEVWNADSLAVLYEISCELNRIESNGAPFENLLKLISQHLHGHAAFIRLISEDGWMDL